MKVSEVLTENHELKTLNAELTLELARLKGEALDRDVEKEKVETEARAQELAQA